MAFGDGVVSTGGMELHITNATGVLTKVVGLLKVNRPGVTLEEAETTDQDSGGTKRYRAGMADIAELAAELNHEPGSPTDIMILEHVFSKETRPCKIVEVKEDGTKYESSGELFLKTYVPNDGSLGATRTASLTGRVGPLTSADA